MNKQINQTTMMIHKVKKIEFETIQFFETFVSRKMVITQEQDGVEVFTEIILLGESGKQDLLCPTYK